MNLFNKPALRFVAALVFLLIGCLVLYTSYGRPRNFGPPNKYPDVPQDQASCLLRGGAWQSAFARYECNMRTADAGRVCASSSECDGNCLADVTWQDYQASAPSPGNVTGHCSPWYSNNGCMVFVEERRLHAICGD